MEKDNWAEVLEQGQQIKQLLGQFKFIVLGFGLMLVGFMAAGLFLIKGHFEQIHANQIQIEEKIGRLTQIVDQKKMNIDSDKIAEILKQSLSTQKQSTQKPSTQKQEFNFQSDEAQWHNLINRYYLEEE